MSKHQLQKAIDAAYATFASVPKPLRIDGCSCCVDDKEAAVLLTTPLREISPSELSSYASSVFLTVGDRHDFRYFLPRILEISASDLGWWPDIEVIGRALDTAQWLTWSPEEKGAVLAVLEAQFEAILSDTDGPLLDSWLCAVSRAGLDLAPYLGRIATVVPAVHSLYHWNSNAIAERRLTNGFWDDSPRGAAEVIDWFYSVDVSLMILKAGGIDLNMPQRNPKT